MTKIWSYRWSVARGWQWVYERDCYLSNIDEWLSVFRNDEPNVTFTYSNNKPKNKLN